MQITEITNKKEWDKILKQFPDVCFLQSWNWGEFEESLGNRVFRITLTNRAKTLAAQFYINKSRLFTYIYLPRGPVGDLSLFNKLVDHLKEVAKQEQVDFILIEPNESEIGDQLNSFVRQPSMQPENSSLISLSPELTTLQSNLRKTTRQMIKKAKENKVKIRVYTDSSHWEEFAKLFTDTTQRQGFNPHSLNYMRKQLEIFSKSGQAKLYLAELDEKAIAGAIIVSHQKTSVYLHAASSSAHREFGGAHLLLWTVIQEAKEAGDTVFDLWGVAPENQPNHPWTGISIFKYGFGGKNVSYQGGFILPINQARYNLYRLMRLLRALPAFNTIQRTLLSAITKG